MKLKLYETFKKVDFRHF